MSRVIVVGGGAAGMMAAIAAAECGHSVRLLEQNEKLGKKLYITGKGRCNLTNACGLEGLFENVVTNPKFLYSAFYDFSNGQVMSFLETAGCRLKTERGGRVFPVSDHASDVTAALQSTLNRLGVEVRLYTRVQRLLFEAGCITGVLAQEASEKRGGYVQRDASDRQRNRGKMEKLEKLSADAVILATGGLSYPGTGSTGDGFAMAQECGHRIQKCVPALVPFTIKEKWCTSLQGLSLKNITLRMECGGKKLYESFGELLFTHFGISGPLALSASSYYGKCRDKDNVFVFIDLKPALSEEQLDNRILRDFQENLNRQFKNVLGGLYPAKLIPVMIEQSGISPEKKVHEITRQERERLSYATKHLRMQVMGVRDFAEAVITQGGIAVKEVNPSTMESKLIRGLYFAGEMLDVDALTGGFNLQIAWSTGHLAGSSVQ